MIDTKELRPAVEAAGLNAISMQEVLELLDRLEAAESDALEQARLNGMGSEREASLLAKLEAAEKSDAESIAMYRKARDERDALLAKIETLAANLRGKHSTAGATYAHLIAERDALRAAVRHEADCVEACKSEIDALRAKIEAMEKQESGFRERCTPAAPAGGSNRFQLYALPGAQAQNVPKAVAYLDLGTGGYMDIGTGLTDEELATLPKGRHMLGVIGTYGVDGYVPVQLAPSVPDGYKLEPIVSTIEMDNAGADHCDGYWNMAQAVWDAMLAAAPEAKP